MNIYRGYKIFTIIEIAIIHGVKIRFSLKQIHYYINNWDQKLITGQLKRRPSSSCPLRPRSVGYDGPARGQCAAPLRGITPIATLERFVVFYSSELIMSGRAPQRAPGNCSSCYARRRSCDGACPQVAEHAEQERVAEGREGVRRGRLVANQHTEVVLLPINAGV